MREHRPNDPFRFYAGQLPALGRRAQRRLADATVLVVGAGRIGTNAVLGFHAAGVGAIDVIDPQIIEAEQIGPCWFVTSADIGQSKAMVLGRFLSQREAGEVRGHHAPVESPAVAKLFTTADLVMCCANTVSARLTAERLAIASSIPIIQAAAFDGRTHLGGLVHMRTPDARVASCYGCFLNTSRHRVRRGEGLLPSVTAMVGHLAAYLAVLELAAKRRPAQPNLFVLDLERGVMEPLTVARRPGCSVCG
ncbi:MAG TPA: ThiF family adenylyltransferase [Bryobacteraceae bacterium]|nr:ThiF family adenylyltransferase [Bryobacteraceae bacterium]